MHPAPSPRPHNPQQQSACQSSPPPLPLSLPAAPQVKSLSKIVAIRNKVKASATPRITGQSKEAASAWDFVQRWLAYAAESVRERGTGFAPLVAFEPGAKCQLPEAELEEQAQVQGEHAFESPDTLTRFVLFCRQQGEGLAATAVVAIVPQPAVAFPQVRPVHRCMWVHARAAAARPHVLEGCASTC